MTERNYVEVLVIQFLLKSKKRNPQKLFQFFRNRSGLELFIGFIFSAGFSQRGSQFLAAKSRAVHMQLELSNTTLINYVQAHLS